MQVIPLGWETLFESINSEKNFRVNIDICLNMRFQCNAVAKRADEILDCIKRGLSSRNREVILPLYTALVRQLLEYRVQFCSPHFKRDVVILERVQRRGATKMIQAGAEKNKLL